MYTQQLHLFGHVVTDEIGISYTISSQSDRTRAEESRRIQTKAATVITVAGHSATKSIAVPFGARQDTQSRVVQTAK